jgi:hypothetical protein
VQFPNLALIVALVAGESGRFVDRAEHPYTASVFYVALTIWAYQELVGGVNWFRRTLGFATVIVLGVRVVHAV